MSDKAVIKYPTKPQMRCHTTLWKWLCSNIAMTQSWVKRRAAQVSAI